MVIISYNEKEYLSAAIESCLNQKCDFSFEIIVGDDGSSDGSIKLIESYAERYPEIIRYFVMDRSDTKDIIPSIRVSNVLKRAFQEARGEYLSVISGDDLLLSDQKFSQQVGFLEEHRTYAGCYTDFKRFWNSGEENEIPLRGNNSNAVLWAGMYVHISCWMFRKTVLAHLLDRFCDDTGLLFSILKTGKVKHLPFMGFGYRQREKSIMHEADYMELSILELCLFQDCLNLKGLTLPTYCRFWHPMKQIMEHREQLLDSRFLKYRNSCALYEHNILNKIWNYDRLSALEKMAIFLYVKTGGIIKFLFRARGYLERRVFYR